MLTTPLVWSDLHRRHQPGGEIWVGVRTPGTELAERAERIRAELLAAGAPIVTGLARGVGLGWVGWWVRLS